MEGDTSKVFIDGKDKSSTTRNSGSGQSWAERYKKLYQHNLKAERDNSTPVKRSMRIDYAEPKITRVVPQNQTQFDTFSPHLANMQEIAYNESIALVLREESLQKSKRIAKIESENKYLSSAIKSLESELYSVQAQVHDLESLISQKNSIIARFQQRENDLQAVILNTDYLINSGWKYRDYLNTLLQIKVMLLLSARTYFR